MRIGKVGAPTIVLALLCAMYFLYFVDRVSISTAAPLIKADLKISNTQLDLTQGSMEATNRPLDVGIQGNGFFSIKILDSLGLAKDKLNDIYYRNFEKLTGHTFVK